MNSDPLNDLLSGYAKETLPPPPQLTAAVWRDIEQRRRRSFWSGLLPALDWRELFLEPRLVVPALAIALLAGMLPGAMTHLEAKPEIARDALHFQAFSLQATGFNPPKLAAIHQPTGQP